MDKTQELIDALIILQDHESDGQGECACWQCEAARKLFSDNPKEAASLSKLIRKNFS